MTAVLVATEGLAIETPRGALLVDDVSLTLHAGELVVVVGPSGAGKTTLLQALAGLRGASRGCIDREGVTGSIGYVPQDDIVHCELTVEENVRDAARLRVGRGLDRAALDALVAATLASVSLSDRADVAVTSVSGGQRKRVSIATELVARPAVCFLDEPTSGLDPAASRDLMGTLTSLTAQGTSVVATSHNLADLRVADRVIVLAPGGRIVFDGPPAEAPEPYRTDAVERSAQDPRPRALDTGGVATTRVPRAVQVAVLARRNLTVMARNRMSAAIMAGSPIAVVAMMAVLFRAHAAGPTAPSPEVAHAFAYWLAFAGFFFGLTFGLLQITTEISLVRRELHGPVDLDAYLLAKVAVLIPVLAAVDLAMVAVLVGIDRITGAGARDLALLLGLLLLDSACGLAIGLLLAAVAGPVQATLALPMLCFPAVLFGGAIVPVDAMTSLGRGLAAVTSTRWAFDALRDVLVPGVARPGGAVAAMVVIAGAAAVGCRVVLAHRTRTS